MKKFLLSVLIAVTFSATADQIPPQVEKLIKVYWQKSYSLSDGRLTIIMKKEKVTDEMIRSFYQGLCYGQFGKTPWPADAITSVVMLNVDENQGYTVKGGGKECKKIGSMTGDESNAYIKSLIYAN
ncbi:hypothetical protein [Dickeya dianthicola]|uniref:hypothetical protein n=1 Tax=Dickeya dianthicola TaxID=204039 RepID=UPI0018676719|nr:hypothetical protein [Dickeya dianthicola]MCI4223095.1 hypothetical protein [Dickeya dianthicola]QOL12741.1 hypothetical protein HGI48_03100 [Dickeya dianthicola]